MIHSFPLTHIFALDFAVVIQERLVINLRADLLDILPLLTPHVLDKVHVFVSETAFNLFKTFEEADI